MYKRQDHANKRIIHQFLPLDVKIFVKRFLDHWSPQLSIFMESEIWPNYFLELDRRRIPLYVLNARLSDQSFKRWLKLRILADKIFSIPKLISCQDNDTYQRYRLLYQSNIVLSENIKYANTPLKTNTKEYQYLKKIFSKKFVYIAASVHENETEIFFNLHRRLLEKYPNTVCIFAPRHPETCSTMISLLGDQPHSWSYLPNHEVNPNNNFFIVNEVGILGTYFELSEIAIIGGSYDNIGGHNPIEAIQKNCIVLHGKNIQNFTDVSDETAEGALKEGVDEFTFTQKYEREFLDNMALLSNTHATKYTRASDFVEKIAMETRKLLESGEAYQTDQGVFAVSYTHLTLPTSDLV